MELDAYMKDKNKFVISVVIILVSANLCYGMSLFKKPEYYLASFEGKVIDVDTKEPIEGAVVLAIYHKTVHTIAGSNTYVIDGQETLTNANGEFKISPKTVHSEKISGKPRGSLVFFKPGYGVFPRHKQSEAVGENKSWPPPNKYIVYEIPKLRTMKERRKNARMWSIDKISYEKQKLYIEKLNSERKNLGLPLIHISNEKR